MTPTCIYDRANAPPQPSPSATEHTRTGTDAKSISGLYEMSILHVALWTRVSYWVLATREIFALVALDVSLFKFNPNGIAWQDIGTTTPTFILGTFLVLVGASIRFVCFHKLGVHYAFKLSLRSDHKLVRTWPYSIVRHPAYAGGQMLLLGGLLTLMGSGSWWYSGAGYTTKVGMVLGGSYAMSVMVLGYASVRGAKEDVYLKREFGEEWERWARDVPYRYIPFVV